MRGSKVAGILLAAGQSTRMGSNKALLPWLGTALVDYQVSAMLQAGVFPLAIVLGHEAERVAAALAPLRDGVSVVINPAFGEGRSSSIRAGVEALPPGVTDILIHAVDQPRTAETLRELIAAHLRGRHLITVPSCAGRRGHPLLVSAALRLDLVSLREHDEGLRGLMRRNADGVAHLEMQAPEVLININTPADYQDALLAFQSAEQLRDEVAPFSPAPPG